MPTEVEANQLKNKKQVKEQLSQDIKKQRTKSMVMVILGSMIYMISVLWVFQLGGFFAGGVTGCSQLIVALLGKIWPELADAGIDRYFSLIFIAINIPLLVLGYKSMSKFFATLTIVSIIIQTVVSFALSNFTVSPLVFLLEHNELGILDAFGSNGFSIIRTATTEAALTTFKTEMAQGTRLVLAMFGGLLSGLGSALCLREGGSAGGTDILANYIMFKYKKSFVKYQFTIDIVIIVLSSLLSVENVLFTVVCLIVKTFTLHLLYQTYNTNRLEIITTKPDEIRTELLKNFYHGMTIYEVTGGYTMTKRSVIEVFVSSYEVRAYRRIIMQIDPQAFIISSNVKLEKGNYIQKTIV